MTEYNQILLIMKIEASHLGYKVIDRSSDLGEFHISSETIESIKHKLRSASLEDMIFNTSLTGGIWEISAPIPNGTGEAIASLIPSVMGKLQKQDDGTIICTE
jgi:hypothetical protein